MNPIIEIQDLHAEIDEKEILTGISLRVLPGEVHAIMGPNGSGKSTLSKVLAGHPQYKASKGTVTFKNENLLEMSAELRARKGLFIGYQYPVEVAGVNNAEFLRLAYNTKQKEAGLEEADPLDFDMLLDEKMKFLDMDARFKERDLNSGFSGGEKKRNEILQLSILNPTLSILDETDSGLDIDALRIVASGLNKLRRSDNAFILITHYQRLLDYIEPNQVHVLSNGRIIRSGDKELAKELEEQGYDWLTK